MNRCVAGLVLLMLACSQPPSPMTMHARPPILPLSQVEFSCRLPVLDVSKPGVNDAFITFPAGTLTPAGTDGWNYDWAVDRWLPVGRNAISPDGRRYAIAKDWSPGPQAPTRVHVVDAATGADLRVTVMPDSRQYAVADFTSSGVSVVPFEAEPGVWRLDPDTGALTKVSDGFYQPPVGEWIGVVDPGDPDHQFSHATGSPVAQPDRIDRRDGSGTTTTWIYLPGYWLYWFAFAGSPRLLVEATRVNTATSTEDYEFLLVVGPGRLKRLAGYSGQQLSLYRDLAFATGLAEDHGIWMSGSDSLYLIQSTGAISRVSDHGGVPVNDCK